MAGFLDGKVAFISGAARGQGRAHALRLAQEGARIIGFDICAHIDTVPFSMATPEDLAETRRLVTDAGGEIEAVVADVRDPGQVQDALRAGMAAFGRVDVVVANAGIGHPFGPFWEISEEAFVAAVDVNLTGVWRTVRAAVPSMIEQGDGGSVVVTGSGASVKGLPNLGAYVAAKHGLVGLMHVMARELGPHRIRVNAVLPGNTNTPMFHNDAIRRLFVPGDEEPTPELFEQRARIGSPLGLPWVEPREVADAVAWLVSPAAGAVTGICVPVDGGTAIP